MSERERFVRATLKTGDSVFIVVDRTCCVLPKHLKTRKVCLEIGDQMDTPIPDLVVDSTGIRATLEFGKHGAHPVHVPWEAILEAYDSSGSGWEF